MFGVLNLNKPASKTSRDVVNIVQRLARPLKVGHAGTLDPLATGVLLTCVGTATRLISYAQQMPKRYRATFQLGSHSDTEDVEGVVEQLDDPPQPTADQLTAIFASFVGNIEQQPPAYSALKVNGERAYKLARQGKSVELQPRPIVVHSIELVAYNYPNLELDIRCGSGTYVRSLGRDIARAVGTEAVMSALCRTEIGSFTVDDALDPTSLDANTWQERLAPVARLLPELPTMVLTSAEIEETAHGRFIENRLQLTGQEIAALDSHQNLQAILKPRAAGRLSPKINFIAKN